MVQPPDLSKCGMKHFELSAHATAAVDALVRISEGRGQDSRRHPHMESHN